MEKTYTQAEVDRMLAACIERCAKVCDQREHPTGQAPWDSEVRYCAKAIRALALRATEQQQQGKP